jgi:hypothetical protein
VTWWHCHGIFTASYLRQHVLRPERAPSEDEVRSLYEFVRTRWSQNLPAMRRRREPFTRSEFLDPVLRKLGWDFIPEEALPDTHTRKKPDYCLFGDADAKARVAAGTGEDIFRAAQTVLEAKKAQHSLDQVSDTETPGWFPSEQIQDYLRRAKDSTGRRFFNWAILTNGNEWRLYCENAGPSAYFALHLAHGAEFCSPEDFRLFVALFRPSSFERDPDGRCLLDDLREESLTLQVQLEENLRKRVFDVLEELSEGFFFYPDNHLTESDLPSVYETALIFLYRLLFILYAESRGLLPVKRAGAGARSRYLDEYSLARLVPRLKDRDHYSDALLPDLYEELLRLFHLVNGTQPARNRAIGVTRYNGGLFDPSQYPAIDEWRVGERTLANVLRQLMFAQPPSRGRARQLAISTEETIDYSTLEVRQLGDIYEGLLGGRLQRAGEERLDLVNERGENQRQGIFYTPDWVVLFLRSNALQPLVDEIEQSERVQAAIRANRRDNSFTDALLKLKVLDPAMGSAHFLVRATEWVADQIVRHRTTKRVTEQIVATGDSQRSREAILADGRVPVSPGVPQEQAEVAYWRRRVVESCIYGVDINPLAVELAKLALWLTCIAIEEPLNFLDHHLRCGNSLLFAHPDEMAQLPASESEEAAQLRTTVVADLRAVLGRVIQETGRIAAEPSTQAEVVKDKQRRWEQVHRQLDPFIRVADLWLAARDGLNIEPDDYRLLVLHHIGRDRMDAKEKRRARKLASSLEGTLREKREALSAFHWRLEFPEVFFASDGSPLPPERSGFDCALGNPPYISTHTSSEERWRNALERRAGYLEDLYVHFTDLGFQLLRPSGTFGFIVSDTFFTLASKLRLRELLQSNRLLALGQCDPFRATVDAAIFVARKQPMADDEKLLFVQARYASNGRKPDQDLPDLLLAQAPPVESSDEKCGVDHTSKGCLRLHWVPISLYREALKQAFFEPRPAVLALYRRYNEPVKALVREWWESIESSDRFAVNLDHICRYHASLHPGDITLVGLIAEGGQGLATANNSRFLGYLDGSHQARAIGAKRQQWTERLLTNVGTRPAFLRLLQENGGDPAHPTANVPAWEACIEPLKQHFDARRDLGFSRTDLYRVVPPGLVATQDDFEFTWRQRKADLLDRWRSSADLVEFWKTADLLGPGHQAVAPLRESGDVSDATFCALCQGLLAWRNVENDRRRDARPRKPAFSLADLGLRSGEVYADPSDVPRIAVIYNGLRGRGQWVAFRKGDPEGSRWADDNPIYIEYSPPNVSWLFDNSGRREPRMPVVRNPHLYFRDNITWSRTANHTNIKARVQPRCVFDSDSTVLTPAVSFVSSVTFLALLNTDLLSFICKKLLNNTNKYEITDLRMLPLVVPARAQEQRLATLAEQAIQAKRLTFAGEQPSHELVAFARRLAGQLAQGAPKYLQPPAQLRLLETADACLKVIELAVNWEAEKLYGVEGRGPFDEF